MKIKSLLTIAILSSFLTACGGEIKIGELTILDFNISSIGNINTLESIDVQKWFEEEALKIEEIKALKQLEEDCYQSHSKKAIFVSLYKTF